MNDNEFTEIYIDKELYESFIREDNLEEIKRILLKNKR